jgi:hypothetical protein
MNLPLDAVDHLLLVVVQNDPEALPLADRAPPFSVGQRVRHPHHGLEREALNMSAQWSSGCCLDLLHREGTGNGDFELLHLEAVHL